MREITNEFKLTDQFDYLDELLSFVYRTYNEGLIFIIDEWDCIFRVYKEDTGQE